MLIDQSSHRESTNPRPINQSIELKCLSPSQAHTAVAALNFFQNGDRERARDIESLDLATLYVNAGLPVNMNPKVLYYVSILWVRSLNWSVCRLYPSPAYTWVKTASVLPGNGGPGGRGETCSCGWLLFWCLEARSVFADLSYQPTICLL